MHTLTQAHKFVYVCAHLKNCIYVPVYTYTQKTHVCI
jgi:hypothetical protein